MLLKPWAEIPTPRHLLDENDELEESEAAFLLQYEPWTKISLKSNEIKGKHLVLLAPRLVKSYVHAIGPTTIAGELSCGYTKTEPDSTVAKQSVEFYDYDGDDEQTGEEETILHECEILQLTSNPELVILPVPLLEPRDCNEFTTQLLTVLAPAQITAVSPSNMISTMEYVYGLYTSNVSSDKVRLPLLQPPFVISGAIASVISRCEVQGIPMSTIAVKAEGPNGHEMIDPNAHEHISSALAECLNVATIKHQNRTYDQGMFI